MSFAFVRFTLWTLSGRRPGARPVSPALDGLSRFFFISDHPTAGETIRTLVRKEDFRCPRPGTTTRKQRSWVFFLVSPRECLPVAGLKPTLQRPVQTLPRDQELVTSFKPSLPFGKRKRGCCSRVSFSGNVLRDWARGP